MQDNKKKGLWLELNGCWVKRINERNAVKYGNVESENKVLREEHCEDVTDAGNIAIYVQHCDACVTCSCN